MIWMYDMVWDRMVRYGMGWDGMGWVRMVWCGVVWYGSWLDGWGVLDECVNTTNGDGGVEVWNCNRKAGLVGTRERMKVGSGSGRFDRIIE
ncbi:hypothetical protein EYC84_010930 [Monilinia fructicola]|uniref:Uncharacterized protein n=1 Tax=Monilinia fructicola TaxID=38448 RepID=A0A5M9JA15_MONFR|nr:hypothetical protein EYC84_010930 [Monilinia fructicola]